MDGSVNALKQCDECQRPTSYIKRVHKGRRFCPRCYKKEFESRICPRCGNRARLPKNDPKGVCRKCEIDRPCIRCGRSNYKVGKITPYGPVCNACSPHFRPKESCEVCGRLSSVLTRVSRLAHDCRVCPRCARADYGNCEACKRRRQLIIASDGRGLCKKCMEWGVIPCPECGKPMAAGCGQRCWDCYWGQVLEKRIRLDSAAFCVPQMAEHFEAFCRWLSLRVGVPKAAITIHRYLPFFMEVEECWRGIPGYGDLLAQFGPSRLRKVLLVSRWLEESGHVVPDPAAKQQEAEQRSVRNILSRLPTGSKGDELLRGYLGTLMERLEGGRTSMRSVRLAMTPASALLLTAAAAECVPPSRQILDDYIARKPGQWSALCGFVKYLQVYHKVEIVMPKRAKAEPKKGRWKVLEGEMLALMREKGSGEQFRRRWLSVALAYLHGLPRRAGLMVKESEITVVDRGFMVFYRGERYLVPMWSSVF